MYWKAPSDSSKKGIADSPMASVGGEDYMSEQHNVNSPKVILSLNVECYC